MDKTLHLVDVKVVLVGDGSVGKTSLLISYTKDVFSQDYDPTVFDHFMTTVRVGNHGVKLSMWDTPGQGQYDRFRPLAYSSADIFLICFAIDDPMSLDNALTKWVEQVDMHRPNAPKLFVGTKSDFRHQQLPKSSNSRKNIIPYGIAQNTIQQRGFQYMQCSSLTQNNLRQVFQKAIQQIIDKKYSMKKPKPKKPKQNCSLI